MANLLWFDIVDRRLRARWLPPAYRRRVVQELKDHADEILEACSESVRSTSQSESFLTRRLGDAEHVADCIEQSFRQRHFAGRHPVFTFLLCPIPLSLIIWLTVLAGALLPAIVVTTLGVDFYSPLLMTYVNLIFWLMLNVVPVIIVVFNTWLVLRRVGCWYALLSNGLLILFLGSLCIVSRFPIHEQGGGLIALGMSPRLDLIRMISMVLAAGVFTTVMRLAESRKVTA